MRNATLLIVNLLVSGILGMGLLGCEKGYVDPQAQESSVEEPGTGNATVEYYAKVHNQIVDEINGYYSGTEDPLYEMTRHSKAILQYLYREYPEVPSSHDPDSDIGVIMHLFPDRGTFADFRKDPCIGYRALVENLKEFRMSGKTNEVMANHYLAALDAIMALANKNGDNHSARQRIEELTSYANLNGSDFEKQFIGVLVGSFQSYISSGKLGGEDIGLIWVDALTGKYIGPIGGALASSFVVAMQMSPGDQDGELWDDFDPSFP